MLQQLTPIVPIVAAVVGINGEVSRDGREGRAVSFEVQRGNGRDLGRFAALPCQGSVLGVEPSDAETLTGNRASNHNLCSYHIAIQR